MRVEDQTPVHEVSVEVDDGARIVADVYGEASDLVPVLCLHGLTRNARDFTDVGRRLGRTRLVVAVDVRGRGRSTYDPTRQTYSQPVYARDAAAVCDALDVDRWVFLGTSMGGQVAMRIGGQRPELVAGLVLNDVGPVIERAGLQRVLSYAGKQESVADWSEAVRQLRAISEDATPGLTDDEWLREARQRYRVEADGSVVPDYDPGIVDGPLTSDDWWEIFASLGDVPLLVLRGASSDILSRETVQIMQAVHPTMRAVEVPGRGHVPLLDEPEAMAAVDEFLAGVDGSS